MTKPAATVVRASNLHSLPQRSYRFRVLGMGLASLPLAAVFHENHASWPSWAWLVITCLIWPHLAYYLARRSRDPFHAELRNFMIDSIFAGSWAPLMLFNVLPSVLLLTVVTADKVNSGIRDLWLRSLPGMGMAMIAAGLLTGFALQLQTSMPVLLACLPILVIHTLAVSLSSYRLVRRVQRQNIQLEDINDRYGHAVGDDVLCGIADLIRREFPADSYAGRLGGDEFVIALPGALPEAEAQAERLRGLVQTLDFANMPGLHCSISIGLAQAPEPELGLREWIEAADRSLYRAKHAGRNRVAGHDAVQAPGR